MNSRTFFAFTVAKQKPCPLQEGIGLTDVVNNIRLWRTSANGSAVNKGAGAADEVTFSMRPSIYLRLEWMARTFYTICEDSFFTIFLAFTGKPDSFLISAYRVGEVCTKIYRYLSKMRSFRHHTKVW